MAAKSNDLSAVRRRQAAAEMSGAGSNIHCVTGTFAMFPEPTSCDPVSRRGNPGAITHSAADPATTLVPSSARRRVRSVRRSNGRHRRRALR